MGSFFGKKSSSEILPPIKLIALVKFGLQVLPTSKVVYFSFAPYLGGFVRVYRDRAAAPPSIIVAQKRRD